MLAEQGHDLRNKQQSNRVKNFADLDLRQSSRTFVPEPAPFSPAARFFRDGKAKREGRLTASAPTTPHAKTPLWKASPRAKRGKGSNISSKRTTPSGSSRSLGSSVSDRITPVVEYRNVVSRNSDRSAAALLLNIESARARSRNESLFYQWTGHQKRSQGKRGGTSNNALAAASRPATAEGISFFSCNEMRKTLTGANKPQHRNQSDALRAQIDQIVNGVAALEGQSTASLDLPIAPVKTSNVSRSNRNGETTRATKQFNTSTTQLTIYVLPTKQSPQSLIVGTRAKISGLNDCFAEIVRQVSISCKERGDVLEAMHGRMAELFDPLFGAIQTLLARAKELEKEKAKVAHELDETKSATKKDNRDREERLLHHIMHLEKHLDAQEIQLMELESLRKTVEEYKEREREEQQGSLSDSDDDKNGRSAVSDVEKRTSMRKSSYMRLRAESGDMAAELEQLRDQMEAMAQKEEKARVLAETQEKEIKRLKQMLDRCVGGSGGDDGLSKSSRGSSRLAGSKSSVACRRWDQKTVQKKEQA